MQRESISTKGVAACNGETGKPPLPMARHMLRGQHAGVPLFSLARQADVETVSPLPLARHVHQAMGARVVG